MAEERRPIEDIVDEIVGLGWRVNNIFQGANGAWQCNLWWTGGGAMSRTTEYARGKTMREAVAGALRDVRARRKAGLAVLPSSAPAFRRRT
jgi:hypothetical protein